MYLKYSSLFHGTRAFRLAVLIKLRSLSQVLLQSEFIGSLVMLGRSVQESMSSIYFAHDFVLLYYESKLIDFVLLNVSLLYCDLNILSSAYHDVALFC